MRAIGDAAGYTAAAIYFHFPSKSVYAALIDRSLDRLVEKVEGEGLAAPIPADNCRRPPSPSTISTPRTRAIWISASICSAAACARAGCRPRPMRRSTPSSRAHLRPSRTPRATSGPSARAAQAITADIFAHAAGLLLLHHTARIRMFATDPRKLMQAHVARIVENLEDRQPEKRR